MHKRFFLCLILLCFFGVTSHLKAAPSVTDSSKTYKIYMVLWSGKTDLEKGFMAYLKEKKVKAEYIMRDCEADAAKCHAFVKEIKEMKPDLIYTWSTLAAESIAGKIDAPNKEEDYVWDIPIVSLIAADPVSSKIIYNMEKPGRNVTGVNHIPPIDAQIKSFLSYFQAKKVAVLYTPSESPSGPQVAAMKKASKNYNYMLLDFPYPLNAEGKPDPNQIDQVIENIKHAGADFIYMPADNFLSINSAKVCKKASELKLPTFSATELAIMKGPPLMGLVSRYINVGRFGGYKAYQILVEGANPKEIPYEKLQRFSFIISKKVMHETGFYPPIQVISYAAILEDLLASMKIG
jgi:putative ABC transport system substrate-binding protein